MPGIDARTLRNWLRQANVEWAAHPTDARLKCLTKEQVEGLATLHARPLPSPVSASPALPEAAPARPESEVQILEATILLTTSVSPEANLRKQLACPEAKPSTMQEQLAQLALEVLHEHSQRYERRLRALDALLPQPGDRSADPPVPHASVAAAPSQAPSLPGRSLHPAELQARSRLIPLIEYGARGQYVVMCPQLGELALIPVSPEWFATLLSFGFVGQQGRFTSYRHSRSSRSWRAHRCIHQRHFKSPLGVTDQITIQCLEQAAATLRSLLDSLQDYLSHSMGTSSSVSIQAQLTLPSQRPGENPWSHEGLAASVAEDVGAALVPIHVGVHGTLRHEGTARRRCGLHRHVEDYVIFNNQHYTYLARGVYIEQIQRWMKSFPKERFLILKSEDLYADPATAVQQTIAFLEVPDSGWSAGKKEFQAYNTGGRYSGMEPALRERLLDYYKTSLRCFN